MQVGLSSLNIDPKLISAVSTEDDLDKYLEDDNVVESFAASSSSGQARAGVAEHSATSSSGQERAGAAEHSSTSSTGRIGL